MSPLCMTIDYVRGDWMVQCDDSVETSLISDVGEKSTGKANKLGIYAERS
jgi:hypothetical protein